MPPKKTGNAQPKGKAKASFMTGTDSNDDDTTHLIQPKKRKKAADQLNASLKEINEVSLASTTPTPLPLQVANFSCTFVGCLVDIGGECKKCKDQFCDTHLSLSEICHYCIGAPRATCKYPQCTQVILAGQCTVCIGSFCRNHFGDSSFTVCTPCGILHRDICDREEKEDNSKFRFPQSKSQRLPKKSISGLLALKSIQTPSSLSTSSSSSISKTSRNRLTNLSTTSQTHSVGAATLDPIMTVAQNIYNECIIVPRAGKIMIECFSTFNDADFLIDAPQASFPILIFINI